MIVSNEIHKIDKLEFYIGSSFAFLSIIGITSIYIHLLQFSKIQKLEKMVHHLVSVEKDNTSTIETCMRKLKNELSSVIQINLLNIIDMHQRLIDRLTPLKSIALSRSTSMTDFSPVDSYEESNVDVSNDVCIDEDNELLNECYDSIPLNNIKKNTGLNWLFK